MNKEIDKVKQKITDDITLTKDDMNSIEEARKDLKLGKTIRLTKLTRKQGDFLLSKNGTIPIEKAIENAKNRYLNN